MGKHKYKRKREHAQNKAQHEQEKIRLHNGEKVAPEKQDKAAANADEESKTEHAESMRLRERLHVLAERCSLTDWIIALFTFALAGSAIYQFIIMDGQLHVMQKDQRAWIIPAPIGPQLSLDKPLIALLQYTNTGKTIGKKFTSTMRIEIMNAADGPTVDYSNPLLNSWLEGNLVVPNTPLQQRIDARRMATGTKTEEIIFTQDLKEKYEEGLVWFSVEGIVTYNDIFGIRHWTQFCGVIASPPKDPFAPYLPGITKCAQYNDTDNN
jgi:hypothetical protein